MVGPKTTLFLDEISTGLDSSTTYLIVKSLRNFVHMQQATIFMALLQPQPETYELADDIFLLAEGAAICWACMIALCKCSSAIIVTTGSGGCTLQQIVGKGLPKGFPLALP